MLQLSGAGKRFGPRLLFENADWLITPTEKTALVGANGAGKSTLMKVLGGMESLDYGTMQRMKGMTLRLSSAGWPDALRQDGFRGVPDGLR